MICPKCDLKSISPGIHIPGGDYDDWLEKPHCTECGFESSSDKDPYRDFIPEEDEAPDPILTVWLNRTFAGTFPVSMTVARAAKVFFCKEEEIKLGPIVKWLSGESEFQFEERAVRVGKAALVN